MAFASRKEYEQWVAANPDVVSDGRPLDESMRSFKRLLSAAQSRPETAGASTPADDSCSCRTVFVRVDSILFPQEISGVGFSIGYRN